jgi:hypothetical protein
VRPLGTDAGPSAVNGTPTCEHVQGDMRTLCAWIACSMWSSFRTPSGTCAHRARSRSSHSPDGVCALANLAACRALRPGLHGRNLFRPATYHGGHDGPRMPPCASCSGITTPCPATANTRSISPTCSAPLAHTLSRRSAGKRTFAVSFASRTGSSGSVKSGFTAELGNDRDRSARAGPLSRIYR